jgi:exodeoxyribonuclease-5
MSIILSSEQKDVTRNLFKNRHNEQVQTLGGYAGTGKTTIVKSLVRALSAKNEGWAVMSFTGKATNILRRKGIGHARTIHSMIYQPFTFRDPITGEEETQWEKIPHVDDCQGFLIDEGSMVSEEIHNDLVSFGIPIIYIGDHGQLEPINSDFNIMKNPMYRLETVHRNAGEIAHFAEHLRKGRDAGEFHGTKQVQVIGSHRVEDKHLAATNQIICAYNKTRVQLNQRVREHLGRQYQYVAVGDKVMCLRNNRQLGLFNGMQGVVQKVRRKDRFDFISDDGVLYERVHYDPETFGEEKRTFKHSQKAHPFDYAYAITAHKSQGDEWPNVIVYEQQCEKWDHKRWAYTAASRARNGLLWLRQDKYVPAYLK